MFEKQIIDKSEELKYKNIAPQKAKQQEEKFKNYETLSIKSPDQSTKKHYSSVSSGSGKHKSTISTGGLSLSSNSRQRSTSTCGRQFSPSFFNSEKNTSIKCQLEGELKVNQALDAVADKKTKDHQKQLMLDSSTYNSGPTMITEEYSKYIDIFILTPPSKIDSESFLNQNDISSITIPSKINKESNNDSIEMFDTAEINSTNFNKKSSLILPNKIENESFINDNFQTAKNSFITCNSILNNQYSFVRPQKIDELSFLEDKFQMLNIPPGQSNQNEIFILKSPPNEKDDKHNVNTNSINNTKDNQYPVQFHHPKCNYSQNSHSLMNTYFTELHNL